MAAFFSAFGTVVDFKVVMDPATGVSRGCVSFFAALWGLAVTRRAPLQLRLRVVRARLLRRRAQVDAHHRLLRKDGACGALQHTLEPGARPDEALRSAFFHSSTSVRRGAPAAAAA